MSKLRNAFDNMDRNKKREEEERLRQEAELKKKNQPKPLNDSEQELRDRTGAKISKVSAQLFCQTVDPQSKFGPNVICSEATRCPIVANRWYVEAESPKEYNLAGLLDKEVERSSVRIANLMKPTLTVLEGHSNKTYNKLKRCNIGRRG